MTILLYLHGGDLPEWLINLIFFLFYFVPFAIIFALGLIVYKLAERAEKKFKSQKDQEEIST